jgi:putative sterol carrier protein
VKFLSPEWARELERRLNEHEGFIAALGTSKIEILNVIDAPEGEMRYWISIADGKVSLGVGDRPGAGATVAQSYDTAAALARSELNAVSAFMTGRIRISGDLMALMGLQSALSHLPAVMREMDVEY